MTVDIVTEGGYEEPVLAFERHPVRGGNVSEGNLKGQHPHVTSKQESIGPGPLRELCIAAAQGKGAEPPVATALADATVGAEQRGKPDLGVAHLLDYLDALTAGRLNGAPSVTVRHASPSVLAVDADNGPAQSAYLQARDELVHAAAETGIAMLGIGGSFPAGELGFYTEDLARRGLIALAGANSPALMSIFGADRAVTGTNPFSCALPSNSGRPRVIDQAASEAAWVRVRRAADAGEPIPAGWAIDDRGQVTTDPRAGLAGAMLPAGGVKGANLAIVVEMLAVLAGGEFSLDSPPFDTGHASPRLGCWVIAINPGLFDPEFVGRIDRHFDRLQQLIGDDFGRRRPLVDHISISVQHLDALRAYQRQDLERSALTHDQNEKDL